MRSTRVGIVGCGFVSSMYMDTINLYPDLKLVGAYDANQGRRDRFCSHYNVEPTDSLDTLLSKSDLIVNLTTPENHFQVSKSVLEKGVPVYSEKPMTLSPADARSLVDVALANNTNIFCAPCVHLSEMAETVDHHIKSGILGKIYAVYAEMDDGLVHTMAHEKWLNEFGIPWPAKNEFESGSTLEHAAYTLCLLKKWFGEGELKSVFQHQCVSDKVIPTHRDTADFSCATIQYPENIIARVTCSIVAPKNHQIKVFGEKGVMTIDDVWFFESAVRWQNFITIRRKTLLNPVKRTLKAVKTSYPRAKRTAVAQMDFCRGIHHLASMQSPDAEAMSSMLNINSIILEMNGDAMPQKQHSWLILGTGNMATTISECLRRNGYPIVGVFSATGNRARQMCDQYGLKQCYTSLDDIPAATEKAVAYVASVNKFHYAQTHALISKGYDVLCEKPLTMNATQTAELYKLAKKNNVQLQENLWSLFVPAATKIRQHCEQHTHLELTFCSPIPYAPDARQWQPEAGGCLYDLGIYPLAWAVYLFGEIQSFDITDAKTDHGIVFDLEFTTNHEDGKTTSIRTSFTGSDQYIKVGPNYFTPIYAPEHKSTVSNRIARKIREKLIAPNYSAKDPYAFILDHLNTSACDVENPFPPATSIHLAYVMEDILQAATRKR